MTEEAVQELLRRLGDGDEEALVALHEQYVNLVFSVAIRMLNDQMAAEEVTQDTFMRLWDKSHTYDARRGPFVPWLLTITRRLAIDRMRQTQRRIPQSDTLFFDENPHLWESALPTESGELRRTLKLMLDDLPPEQNEAIALAYFYGLSHSDIAAYRGLPLGTVKTRIRQGMQKLRAAWLENTSES
jgi:RNA polymerase sigma-70 factor (ECF subfamily)